MHKTQSHPLGKGLTMIRIVLMIVRGRKERKEEMMLKLPNARWFTKKSGSAKAAKKKPNWFNMLLKSNIDQAEDHILGLSTVAVAKKIKEIIKKDELTIAYLEGVGLKMLKRQYKNDVELEYHVKQLKAAVLEETRWSNAWEKSTPHLLPSIFPQGVTLKWEDARKYFFKAELGKRSSNKVYSDKRIISVVKVTMKRKWGYGFLTSIVVKRSDKKEYEFSYADLPRLSLNDVEDMYLLKVQDKLHHLKSDFEIDFNNALLLFIRRVIIQNRIDDLQLGVESYQRTINLTKPKFYFQRIDQKIPYTTSGTENGVVYVNQHNMKSLMKLNEVSKFCDGTMFKVRENLLKMVNENVMGRGNKRLNGRD
nr:hypothetical protein [Tanacetum cinerariifolium]